MHLELVDDGTGKINTTRVKHKVSACNLQVILYVKSLLRTKFDIFAEINSFLASLPILRQDKIYEQFMKVFEAMDDISSQQESSQLISRISQEVGKLYELIPEEECIAWITNNQSGILLPPDVTFDPQHRDVELYEDMTYSLADHIKLAGYSMALRLMMPIWGNYNRSANEEKETAFKEMNAILLLQDSWLDNCAARQRLKVYITRVLQSDKTNTNATATFAGIGREQSIDYHLSKTIVRRLPISPISNDPTSDKSTLVSNVYNFIRPTPMTSLDRSFDATVDDKHRLVHDNADDRSSYHENYKIKERLPAGDAVMLSKSLVKLEPLLNSIDPTVDKEIVADCKAVMNSHDVTQLLPHQIALLKMVIGIVYSPDTVDCVDRPAILTAICATQAVLWHWGFNSLAAMLTVVVPEGSLKREKGQSNRLTKEESLQMSNLYPFHVPVARFIKGDEYTKAKKENTTSYIVIREFADNTEAKVWYTSCPERLLSQYIGYSTQRHIATPDNVKSMLAKLIVKINETMDANYLRKRAAENVHAL